MWAAPEPPTYAPEELISYLVDTPDGPVGILSDIKCGASGNPATLIIGQGWFYRRKLHVSADSILAIDHRARRIILVAGSAPLEPNRWLRFLG